MPWEGLKGDGRVKECCVAASEPSSPCQLAEGETGLRNIEIGERIIGIALSLPTEVHVEEAVFIETISYPRSDQNPERKRNHEWYDHNG